MQVTNVTVSFSRKKQPAKFEETAPMVEFSAVFDEGDCYIKETRTLLYNAAEAVYAGIGYDVPTKVAEALRKGSTPNGVNITVNVASQKNPSTDQVDIPAEEQEVVEPLEEEKPKTRGRPRGSKNTMPKKNTKAAEEAAKPVDVSSDDIPDDIPNIRANPEDRVDLDGYDGIPEQVEATSTVNTDPTDPTDITVSDYTARDLHDFVRSAVDKKDLSPANAKQLQAHFKVSRFRDLSPEQAVEGRDMALKMMEAV